MTKILFLDLDGEDVAKVSHIFLQGCDRSDSRK
jgi:hypothetical protein